ncbi:MAG: hypothetical protein Q9208_000013 [Pyrenodesmia sp. 3 TL-2023]
MPTAILSLLSSELSGQKIAKHLAASPVYGPVMTRLDVFDRIATSIFMREELRCKAPFDQGFMEAEWIRSFETIEEIILALLFIFGIRIDAEQGQNGNHRFHSNLFKALDDTSGPFYELLGGMPGASQRGKIPAARRRIDDLRLRRIDAKSRTSQDASETPKGVDFRYKVDYRRWYRTVFEALIKCLKICIDYNTCKDHGQVIWPSIYCLAGSCSGPIYETFASWKAHALVYHPGLPGIAPPESQQNPQPSPEAVVSDTPKPPTTTFQSSLASIVSEHEAALRRIAELEKDNTDLKATSDNAKHECTRLSRCLEETVRQHEVLSGNFHATKRDLLEESKKNAARFEQGKAIGAREVWQSLDALRAGSLVAVAAKVRDKVGHRKTRVWGDLFVDLRKRTMEGAKDTVSQSRCMRLFVLSLCSR